MNESRRVKDIVEYLKEVSRIKTKWPNSTLVFRGQENEVNKEWHLDSSAERRLKESIPSQEEITDSLFLEYNENLIKKCRLKNYHKREQTQLDELELLADLQHYGAATCLIDFTRNALVALWFACKKSDANGKVFVVNTADKKTFLEITHRDIANKSISEILQFKTRNTDKDKETELPTLLNKLGFWYWTPAHLNERITAQHSLFLFGLPSLGEMRSDKIIIESANKEQIRKELEELHDIREESLFPDFVGFAYIQRADAPYLTPNSEQYFLSGVKAGQQGQYSESIQDLTKAIDLNPNYAEAYAIRGGIYNIQGDYDRAIQDSTKTIDLSPDHAEAYAIRGMAYCSQGDYDRAIQDLTKTIKPSPDYAETHFARAIAWLHLKKWKKAKSDLIIAKDMGLDIVTLFSQYTENLTNSKQTTGITLPEDIAAMLTESEN